MTQSNRGFTLIEILVALAILSISLIAISHATQQAIYNVRHLKEKLFAQMVAMNVLRETQLDPATAVIEKAIFQKTVSMADIKWFTTVTVEQVSENMKQITVSVAQKEKSSPIETVRGFE